MKVTNFSLRRRTYFLALFVALFLVMEGITIYALVVDGHWIYPLQGSSIFTCVFLLAFLLGVDVLIILLPWQAYNHERAFVSSRDMQKTIVVQPQPEPSLALQWEESLIIEQHRRTYIMLTYIITLLFVGMLIAMYSESGIFAILPAFGESALNPFHIPILDSYPFLPPKPIDWIAAAFPIVLLGTIFSGYLFPEFRPLRRRISADDRGIHVGRDFIAWNEIQYFTKAYMQERKTVGNYWVSSHHVHLQFSIAAQHSSLTANQKGPLDFIFTNGYEVYLHDAERLIATIIARSYQPLRMSLVGSPKKLKKEGRYSLKSLSLAQALASPLASVDLQPKAPPEMANDDVRLQKQDPIWRHIQISFILAMAFLETFYLLGVFNPLLTVSSSLMTPLDDNPFQFQIALFFVIIFLSFFAVAYDNISYSYRKRHPMIIAGKENLICKTSKSLTTMTIPWAEIRAWGILPPRPGSRDVPRYVVVSDDGKIIWSEPLDAALGGRGVRGDRRAAYQQRAAELHALIAARTGLPLHDLSGVRDSPQITVAGMLMAR